MLKARAVFLSDIHLGSFGCQAEALLQFLNSIETEKVYLLGDIIDGWRLEKNWFFPQSHLNVLRKFISMSKKGIEIVYIPGNHDEFLRKFHDFDLKVGNIVVKQKYVHKTLQGKEYLMVHGDAFEAATFVSTKLFKLGDVIYTWLIKFNRFFNQIRANLGLPYWSISKWLKHHTKQAMNFVFKFEEVATRTAKNKNYTGIMCGHIHTPAQKVFDGVEYWNTGDWVESCSFIYEDLEGNLHLKEYKPLT